MLSPDHLRSMLLRYSGRPGGDVGIRPPGLAGQESLLNRLSRQIRSGSIQELVVRQVSCAARSYQKVEASNRTWSSDMSDPQQLKVRAAMFERRAAEAEEPVSRAHYREMAAHYRALAVEHQSMRTAQLAEDQETSRVQ